MSENEQNNCARLISLTMYSAIAALNTPKANLFRSMYVEPADQSIAGQIKAANSFWRVELGLCDARTTEARECLQDNMELGDWLRLFSQYVTRAIVDHWNPTPTMKG